MFDRLRARFTKPRPRSYLDKYLTDDLMKALANEPWTLTAPPPQAQRVEFIIVNIDDRDPEQVNASFSAAISICFHGGCTIDTSDCTLVRAVIGMFGPTEAGTPQPDRRTVVADLQRTLGRNIRIVHGGCEALVGQFGNEVRLAYNALIPNSNAVLRTLLDLDFGAAVEIPFATMPASLA